MTGDIPASWVRHGYVSLESSMRRNGGTYRGIMIGTDGQTSSGKSEFAHGAPGPGVNHCIDKNIDGMAANPSPPPTRTRNFGLKIYSPPIPAVGQMSTQADYVKFWCEIRDGIYTSCSLPEVRTVIIDGDSDGWEIQRMAEFGRIHQVPSHLYTTVNSARRGFYNRLWSSGKIIIATNKVTKEYKTVLDANGRPVMKDGKEQRAWTGNYERQGFADQEYLWQLQLHHMYSDAEHPGEWGVRLTMCKPNRSLEGLEFWGTDCNLKTVLQEVYPNVPLREWGY